MGSVVNWCVTLAGSLGPSLCLPLAAMLTLILARVMWAVKGLMLKPLKRTKGLIKKSRSQTA